MKVALIGLFFWMALMPIAVGEETVDLSSYFDGYTSSGVIVVAFDPEYSMSEPMSFDAIPLDYDTGWKEDGNSLLEAAQDVTQTAQMTVAKDEQYDVDNWRFAIHIAASKEASSSSRWLELDFYDDSDVRHLRIVDREGESENVLLEENVRISEEVALWFEGIYLETVTE